MTQPGNTQNTDSRPGVGKLFRSGSHQLLELNRRAGPEPNADVKTALQFTQKHFSARHNKFTLLKATEENCLAHSQGGRFSS